MNIRPIAQLIKYNPAPEVVAAEWTGKQPQAKPQAKRPTFGKKGAR
jgi:hypothetical protein